MDDPDGGDATPNASNGDQRVEGTGRPSQVAERRLRRHQPPEIGGVAAGMADYVGIDPKFFRIAFVVMTLLGGSGLVIYLAAWLLVPTDDDPDPRPLALTSNIAGLVAGFIVLAAGALVAIEGDTWGLGPAIVIPIVMIMIGLWLLNQRAEPTTPLPPPPAPHRGNWPPPTPDPAVTAHPSPPQYPSTTPAGPTTAPGSTTPAGSTPPSTAGLAPAPSGQSPTDPPGIEPGDRPTNTGGPPPWDQPVPTQPWALPIVESGPERTGPPVTSITLAAVAVAGGVFLVLHNVGGISVSATLVVGTVLAIVGAGLVVSAFTERALALYPLGVLALAVLFVAPLIDTTLSGGVGTRQVHVASPAGLEPTYSMGMGELIIDLGDLRLTESAELDVEVGAGYAEIVVPADIRVEVRASSRAGYVEVFDLADEGVRNEIFSISEPSSISGGERRTESDPPTLRIDAEVTFGYVEVRRG
ncbi:MAG: PspC domain-containing protein [Acidimicrobiia bacterium]|nr:PspC domain-containing protein [Acidimicrobiia bacterium]